MRNGPSVRKRLGLQQSDLHAAPPLKLLAASRGLAKSHGTEGRALARPPTVGKLDACLPLNLRLHLLRELGARLRCDTEGLTTQALECGNEAVLREVARAIRRFSSKRAREPWNEFIISLPELTERLRAGANQRQQAVLCLRCERIEVGPAARESHRVPSCAALELYAASQSLDGELADSMRELTRQGLYRLIEAFRHRRSELGLPHFDLDYYMHGSNVIFTWRPLSERN